MAQSIAFEPKPVDPKKALQKRLEAAPVEHAEALLVAYDVLQEAHDQGILDLLHGAIGSKQAILGKLSEFAKEPEATQAMRNGIMMAKLLGSIDPDRLHAATKSLTDEHIDAKPPSLWQIFKRTISPEGRRGLGMMTLLLTGLGTKKK